MVKINGGEKPHDLKEDESAVYDLTVALLSCKGPLDSASWERANKSLGRDQVLSVIHYVALYSGVCIQLNAADVGLPHGEKLFE